MLKAIKLFSLKYQYCFLFVTQNSETALLWCSCRLSEWHSSSLMFLQGVWVEQLLSDVPTGCRVEQLYSDVPAGCLSGTTLLWCSCRVSEWNSSSLMFLQGVWVEQLYSDVPAGCLSGTAPLWCSCRVSESNRSSLMFLQGVSGEL